jgi:hypothetical protein
MTTNTLIAIPLHALRGIIFGQFGDCSYPIDVFSPLLGEKYYVKPISYAIGKTIAELDREESLFHVEFIEPQKQAEIWLAEDWRESNTRRMQCKNRCTRENEVYDKNREMFNEIHPLILAKFSSHPALAIQLTHQIIKHYKANSYPDVLEYLGVAEVLTKYRNQEL